MKISEVIQKVKEYHNGKDISQETTRDQILYGDPQQECTGIVTTCWATMDVIRKAKEAGANLIIAHEALFWNHGDHQEWLQEQGNKTYISKKQLLDETGIVVWRDHDHIHAGIPLKDGTYSDGIFYGFASMMGWTDYITTDTAVPLMFEIPEISAAELGKQMVARFHLEGTKIVGDLDTKVRRVYICAHVMGHKDNDLITFVDQKEIDLLISLELVDYTLSEYIRDSCMAGNKKAILALGHFNAEEPGMEYMTSYLPEAINAPIPCQYIQSGDMFHFITR